MKSSPEPALNEFKFHYTLKMLWVILTSIFWHILLTRQRRCLTMHAVKGICILSWTKWKCGIVGITVGRKFELLKAETH